MAEATPWEIVQVDSSGPWKAKVPEICEITDKRSQTVMDAFRNNYLCRYPRPI
jgi:hypothetical protein